MKYTLMISIIILALTDCGRREDVPEWFVTRERGALIYYHMSFHERCVYEAQSSRGETIPYGEKVELNAMSDCSTVPDSPDPRFRIWSVQWNNRGVYVYGGDLGKIKPEKRPGLTVTNGAGERKKTAHPAWIVCAGPSPGAKPVPFMGVRHDRADITTPEAEGDLGSLYPKIAKDHGVEALVYVEGLRVSEKGKVEGYGPIRIVDLSKSISPGLDRKISDAFLLYMAKNLSGISFKPSLERGERTGVTIDYSFSYSKKNCM